MCPTMYFKNPHTPNNLRCSTFLQNDVQEGTWVAQSCRHLTLDLAQVTISGSWDQAPWAPCWVWSLLEILSLSLCPLAHHLHSLALLKKECFFMPGTWDWFQSGSVWIQVQSLSAPRFSKWCKPGFKSLCRMVYFCFHFMKKMKAFYRPSWKVWEGCQTIYLCWVLDFVSLAPWGYQNLYFVAIGIPHFSKVCVIYFALTKRNPKRILAFMKKGREQK